MPIYEYECEKCCFKFERFKKVGEDVEVYCPECRSQARRIFSSVPAIFKGSRWVGGKKQKPDSQTKKADNKTEIDKKQSQTEKAENT